MSPGLNTHGGAGRPVTFGSAAAAPADGERRALPLAHASRALLGCAWRTAVLVAARRIHQPPGFLGRQVRFADGTSAAVYRETVIDRPPPNEPALLVVCFRLRGVRREWMHGPFRLESELNTVFFAGFPGLVSKLWLRHDQFDRYRGVYQWDGAEQAVAYVRTLWWVLALVSDPESIHYAVVAGVHRDDVLAEPSVLDAADAAAGGWWRPADSPR